MAVVEHRLAPRVLAAPVHRHTREDEWSFILEGRVGALLGKVEVEATAGALIRKPRGEWHTFWNAGDAPARILEIISPSGIEELFRTMDLSTDEFDPTAMAALAARYGCDIDFERTFPFVEAKNLVF